MFCCCKAAYLALLSSVLCCATVISPVVSHKVLGAMCHISVYQVTKDMDQSNVCMKTKQSKIYNVSIH